MLRRHASILIAVLLLMVVATACLVRTSPGHQQRSRPGYSEPHRPAKHKKIKHKKVKHRKHK